MNRRKFFGTIAALATVPAVPLALSKPAQDAIPAGTKLLFTGHQAPPGWTMIHELSEGDMPSHTHSLDSYRAQAFIVKDDTRGRT